MSNSKEGSFDEKMKDEVQHLDTLETAYRVPKSPEQRQAELDAAMKVDPGVGKWSAAAMHVCGIFVMLPLAALLTRGRVSIRCTGLPWSCAVALAIAVLTVPLWEESTECGSTNDTLECLVLAQRLGKDIFVDS